MQQDNEKSRSNEPISHDEICARIHTNVQALHPDKIWYTAVSGSGVLIVPCHICHGSAFPGCPSFGKVCSFWSTNKEYIMCLGCANENPDKVYRPFFSYCDMAKERCFLLTGHPSTSRLYTDASYKSSYGGHFCSIEDERRELESGIPATCQCHRCKR